MSPDVVSATTAPIVQSVVVSATTPPSVLGIQVVRTQLPNTGSTSGSMALAGAVLLAAGGALVLAGRRSDQRPA